MRSFLSFVPLRTYPRSKVSSSFLILRLEHWRFSVPTLLCMSHNKRRRKKEKKKKNNTGFILFSEDSASPQTRRRRDQLGGPSVFTLHSSEMCTAFGYRLRNIGGKEKYRFTAKLSVLCILNSFLSVPSWFAFQSPQPVAFTGKDRVAHVYFVLVKTGTFTVIE